MLATSFGCQYTRGMSIESDNPIRENWVDPGNAQEWLLRLQLARIGLDHDQVTADATNDPTFDLFESILPTDRTKYDIGRYVMDHGIDVPLISNIRDWRTAMLGGVAMLRSDGKSDYTGLSGVFTSHVIRQVEVYPRDENGEQDKGDKQRPVRTDEDGTVWYGFRRLYEGPVAHEPGFSDGIYSWLSESEKEEIAAKNNRYIAGLLDGTANATEIMAEKFWNQEYERLVEHFASFGISRHAINFGIPEASRWRYVPGINIRIFRDPVIEGKYYIGGREAHHHWEITDGANSPDLEGHTKAFYRGRVESEEPEYTLPTRQIVELYEKVRTLPYFDRTQAPVIEMQYGDDGKLYFLQYLKTGQVISDCGDFALPSGPNAVVCHDVRGYTSRDGESIRIYIDPRKFTRAMEGEGVFIDFDLPSEAAQYAAMKSRLAIVEPNLSFKDNHVTSAPLFRPPLAIGLWDQHGDAWEKFEDLKEQRPFRDAWTNVREVEYINATVTSNGRQATIDSDWQLRTQYL